MRAKTLFLHAYNKLRLLMDSKNKVYNSFKAALHIGMGGVYLAISIAVIYFKAFGTIPLTPTVAYIIGILTGLYGIFRLWRGWMDIKQNRQ